MPNALIAVLAAAGWYAYRAARTYWWPRTHQRPQDSDGHVYPTPTVTSPAEPARGQVQVSDDRDIRWECLSASPASARAATGRGKGA